VYTFGSFSAAGGSFSDEQLMESPIYTFEDILSVPLIVLIDNDVFLPSIPRRLMRLFDANITWLQLSNIAIVTTLVLIA